MGMRRKARECVLQMLYQIDVGGGAYEHVIQGYWKNNDAAEDVRKFANELVEGVARHKDEIDALIAANSTNWRLSRMAAVDKSILRMAVCELVHRKDIPVKVAINEAVEIAKRFGTAESGAFVNGILDNIAKGITVSKEG